MKKVENAFDWDIKLTPVYNAQGEVITGYNEITRDDDNSSIAIMKKTFHPMTTQQFTETAEAVAAKIGAVVEGYEDWQNGDNMGSKRQVVTAQIKVSEPLEIAGSKIQGYLTIGVGFAGNRSFYMGHTNSYLRCSNQFGSIIQDFTSRLTKNNMVRVEEIIDNIQTYVEYEKKLYDNFKKFQEVQIDEKLIKECVARLVKMTDEERADESLISSQKLNKMDDIMASVRSECAELGNNAWGLFNGITHYTTHVYNARTQEQFGNVFGAKNDMNQKVYDLCLETGIEQGKITDEAVEVK